MSKASIRSECWQNETLYFWAMKLQAGKPKAVARCDWCNRKGACSDKNAAAHTSIPTCQSRYRSPGYNSSRAPTMKGANWWVCVREFVEPNQNKWRKKLQKGKCGRHVAGWLRLHSNSWRPRLLWILLYYLIDFSSSAALFLRIDSQQTHNWGLL